MKSNTVRGRVYAPLTVGRRTTTDDDDGRTGRTDRGRRRRRDGRRTDGGQDRGRRRRRNGRRTTTTGDGRRTPTTDGRQIEKLSYFQWISMFFCFYKSNLGIKTDSHHFLHEQGHIHFQCFPHALRPPSGLKRPHFSILLFIFLYICHIS